MKIANFALTLDRYAAYVPCISTIAAIVNMATKIILSFRHTPTQDHYFQHIQSKSALDCLLLIVPFGYVIYHACKPAPVVAPLPVAALPAAVVAPPPIVVPPPVAAPPPVVIAPPPVAAALPAAVVPPAAEPDLIQQAIAHELSGHWVFAFLAYFDAIQAGKGADLHPQSNKDIFTHFQELLLYHLDDLIPSPPVQDGAHFEQASDRKAFLEVAAAVCGSYTIPSIHAKIASMG